MGARRKTSTWRFFETAFACERKGIVFGCLNCEYRQHRFNFP
jgi:hypothetical protein